MVGCQWLRIPAGAYRLVPEPLRSSKCQIEAVVAYDKVETMEPVGEWSRTAPIRICSFGRVSFLSCAL
jgi:DNA polymerase delta subunit 1